LGPQNKIKVKLLRWLEKAILTLVFANTVNTSFKNSFFQLMKKHCVAVKSSKIAWFGRCNDPILPEFTQSPKVGRVLYHHTPRLLHPYSQNVSKAFSLQKKVSCTIAFYFEEVYRPCGGHFLKFNWKFKPVQLREKLIFYHSKSVTNVRRMSKSWWKNWSSILAFILLDSKAKLSFVYALCT